jgi:hypothetical protein
MKLLLLPLLLLIVCTSCKSLNYETGYLNGNVHYPNK